MKPNDIICGAIKARCHKGMTPTEDARLMLDVWKVCIEKKITIEPRSPLHRLLIMTIKRFRKHDKTHL